MLLHMSLSNLAGVRLWLEFGLLLGLLLVLGLVRWLGQCKVRVSVKVGISARFWVRTYTAKNPNGNTLP